MDLESCLDELAASGGDMPRDALGWLVAQWAGTGPRCRALLAAYLDGTDPSERTERALFFVAHAMGQHCDTAAFKDLCRLAGDPERASLVFGEDAIVETLPAILTSTFDGDPAPLQTLIEADAADEILRGQALMILAYLTRTGRLTDVATQAYLAALPKRLPRGGEHYAWFGWAQAIAALGYGGLAQPVEAAMRDGLIAPDLVGPKDFWADLRLARADPLDMSGPAWNGVGPLGDAVDALDYLYETPADSAPPAPAPVRNPVRQVGRNDPCPCGSGRKYKKCCLQAAKEAMPA